MNNITINLIIICILLALALLILIRKKRMKEGYALIWFSVVIGILVLISFQDLLFWIQSILKAGSPSTAILFLALVFLLFMSVNYSIKLSSLEKQNKDLAQKIAILENKIDKKITKP